MVLEARLLVTVTAAGLFGVMVIVCGFEIPVSGLEHVMLVFRRTVTTSLFESEDVVKVGEVCPATFTPLIRHWYKGVVPPLVGLAVNVTL